MSVKKWLKNDDNHKWWRRRIRKDEGKMKNKKLHTLEHNVQTQKKSNKEVNCEGRLKLMAKSYSTIPSYKESHLFNFTKYCFDPHTISFHLHVSIEPFFILSSTSSSFYIYLQCQLDEIDKWKKILFITFEYIHDSTVGFHSLTVK